MSKTLFEAFAVLVLSSAVGLAFNHKRTDKPIDLRRNYFPARTAQPSVSQVQSSVKPEVAKPQTAKQGDAAAVTHQTKGLTETAPAKTTESALDHEFKSLDIYELREFVELGDSSIVLVDARNTEEFEQAHIVGAIQFDYFIPDQYIDNVLAASADAEMIIVYCNGGECEASVNTARYLTSEIENPLPFEVMHVYEGGIKEWCEYEGPVEGECK